MVHAAEIHRLEAGTDDCFSHCRRPLAPALVQFTICPIR
jgi:hypothetical protein